MDALGGGGGGSYKRGTPVDALCKDADDRVDATRVFNPGNQLFFHLLATDFATEML